MRSFRKRSIVAVRIGKFGPLREPIRKLLLSPDRFSHIIINVIVDVVVAFAIVIVVIAVLTVDGFATVGTVVYVCFFFAIVARLRCSGC